MDFSHSQAVLLGAAHTDDRPEMPAASQSLHAMRSTLIGPRCGWPSSRVAVFENPSSTVTPQVMSLLGEATDTVVFYYVGPGVLLGGGRLGLALADTTLRFDRLRTALRARVALVVLDCCFSDVGTFGDITELANHVEDASRLDGAVTLVFSMASREAIYDDRADGLTHFTKAFAETFHHGIPGAGATLSVADVHRATATRLASMDLTAGALRPDPADLAGNPAAQLAFAGNAPPLPPERERRRKRPPVAETDELVATFETQAPWRVILTANLLLAASAGVFGWATWMLLAASKWEWALIGVVFLGMTISEIHVPWWGSAAITTEGLVLRRGPGLVALARAPWSGRAAVSWQDVAVERAVIGRLPDDRTRVTLHVSPETAARMWDSVPFKGYAKSRDGIGQSMYRDRGIAWPLGDVGAPAGDVTAALRASLPDTVAIVELPSDVPTPDHPRPRVWGAVLAIALFGAAAVLLAIHI